MSIALWSMPAARAANEAAAAKSALINDVLSMASFVLFRRGDVTFDPEQARA
jgi:hypothetical protein